MTFAIMMFITLIKLFIQNLALSPRITTFLFFFRNCAVIRWNSSMKIGAN